MSAFLCRHTSFLGRIGRFPGWGPDCHTGSGANHAPARCVHPRISDRGSPPWRIVGLFVVFVVEFWEVRNRGEGRSRGKVTDVTLQKRRHSGGTGANSKALDAGRIERIKYLKGRFWAGNQTEATLEKGQDVVVGRIRCKVPVWRHLCACADNFTMDRQGFPKTWPWDGIGPKPGKPIAS